MAITSVPTHLERIMGHVMELRECIKPDIFTVAIQRTTAAQKSSDGTNTLKSHRPATAQSEPTPPSNIHDSQSIIRLPNSSASTHTHQSHITHLVNLHPPVIKWFPFPNIPQISGQSNRSLLILVHRTRMNDKRI